MARKQKLKVFRVPAGFHDAYVAAPSRKAALEAWGSDADLFARGIAELVTDEELSREPLENPGKVIKRLRGTAAQQLAALPPDVEKRKQAHRRNEDDAGVTVVKRKAPAERRRTAADEKTAEPERRKPSAKPRPKPKPRPSRGKVDEAEEVLAEMLVRQEREEKDLRVREQALKREREKMETAQGREREAAERAVERERSAHAKRLDAWIAQQ